MGDPVGELAAGLGGGLVADRVMGLAVSWWWGGMGWEKPAVKTPRDGIFPVFPKNRGKYCVEYLAKRGFLLYLIS